MLADELEESFGEVVKFLEAVVLDLVREREKEREKHIFTNVYVDVCLAKCCDKCILRTNNNRYFLLGVGSLSGPRAVLVLTFNHKHLEKQNRLSETRAGNKTKLHTERDFINAAPDH